MSITVTAESGIDSGIMKRLSSRIAPLTIDEIPTDITFRDPHSSKSMLSLPLGGR